MLCVLLLVRLTVSMWNSGEILEVQRELTRVTEMLEISAGRKQRMERDVQMATVVVTLNEEQPERRRPDEGVFHPGETFRRAVEVQGSNPSWPCLIVLCVRVQALQMFLAKLLNAAIYTAVFAIPAGVIFGVGASLIFAVLRRWGIGVPAGAAAAVGAHAKA